MELGVFLNGFEAQETQRALMEFCGLPCVSPAVPPDLWQIESRARASSGGTAGTVFFVVPGQEPAATRVQFQSLHVSSLMFESVSSKSQQRVEEQIIETKNFKPRPHSDADELVEVFNVFSQIFFHGVPSWSYFCCEWFDAHCRVRV